MSSQFEKEMQEQVSILGDIALLGQWTVVYAPPNSGKTLLLLYQIIEGIKARKINPDHLYYINADDNHTGLTNKVKLAEQHGFHMLAPGYRGFRAADFQDLIEKLCRQGLAKNTIIVLDTLKKFTDLMDKRIASDFGSRIREFVTKGGTLIGLAHVNKRRDPDGKPIYAGTSDIVDDTDCAYTLDTLSEENHIRTVEFENIKSRGMVAKRAAYRYSIVENLSYNDLLASVEAVDQGQADKLRGVAASAGDTEQSIISAITDMLARGDTAKGQVIEKAASQAGASRRHVERVLDNYTGSDPEEHKWNFSIGPRGAHSYELHQALENDAGGDAEIDDEEDIY